jgi:hypothetical protein
MAEPSARPQGQRVQGQPPTTTKRKAGRRTAHAQRVPPPNPDKQNSATFSQVPSESQCIRQVMFLTGPSPVDRAFALLRSETLPYPYVSLEWKGGVWRISNWLVTRCPGRARACGWEWRSPDRDAGRDSEPQKPAERMGMVVPAACLLLGLCFASWGARDEFAPRVDVGRLGHGRRYGEGQAGCAAARSGTHRPRSRQRLGRLQRRTRQRERTARSARGRARRACDRGGREALLRDGGAWRRRLPADLLDAGGIRSPGLCRAPGPAFLRGSRTCVAVMFPRPRFHPAVERC